jgi:very-short-patch-repair endonuclease
MKGETASLFGADKLPGERAPKKSRGKSAEDDFAFQCEQSRLPKPIRQHAFAKQKLGRRWLFDFAFSAHWLAVEIEGLVVRRIGGELVVTGRHASIKGFKDDAEKYAYAALLGWTVLRFEQSQVRSRFAIEMTMRVLSARGWSVDVGF